MIFVITNLCNRNCDYCFEGDFKTNNINNAWFMPIKFIYDCINWDHKAGFNHTVIGGEATLHPDIIEIADYLSKCSENFILPTNGMCEPEITKELIKKRTSFIFNINNSNENTTNLMDNIRLVSESKNELTLNIIISDYTDNFDFLFDLLMDDQLDIDRIRMGISSPGYKFTNKFPKCNDFGRGQFGEMYKEIVTTIHKINPLIPIENECATNFCMINKDTYTDLAFWKVERMSWECNDIPACILPDGSCSLCFGARGIPELTIDNIFKYENMGQVQLTLRQMADELNRKIGLHCDHYNCTNIGCRGPCVIHNFYRAFVKPGEVNE